MLMSRDIELKIMNGESLTEEEAETYLNWVSKEIRKKQNIVNPYDTDCSKCFECSRDINVVMIGSDVTFAPINIRNQLNIPLTHYSTAITLEVNNQPKSYLIDLTYSQFFKTEFVLDNLNVGSIKDDTQNLDKKFFEKELINKGFVELTDQSLKFYINNFLELSNIESKIIKNTRLNEFKTYLNQNGIIVKEKYLNSKKDLLTQFRDDVIEIINSKHGSEKIQESNKTL